ncbi:MAG: hypothetical protein GX577_15615, partial [Leptolinea sp.]|nr:hypothetical protein [Leptolinea sp.]
DPVSLPSRGLSNNLADSTGPFKTTYASAPTTTPLAGTPGHAISVGAGVVVSGFGAFAVSQPVLIKMPINKTNKKFFMH